MTWTGKDIQAWLGNFSLQRLFHVCWLYRDGACAIHIWEVKRAGFRRESERERERYRVRV